MFFIRQSGPNVIVPGRTRWELNKGEVVLCDGKELKSCTPPATPNGTAAVKGWLEPLSTVYLGALLLLTNKSLEGYTPTKLDSAKADFPQGHVVECTNPAPIPSAYGYTHLWSKLVLYLGASYGLHHVVTSDTQASTRIVFSGHQIDKELDSALFSFNEPPFGPGSKK